MFILGNYPLTVGKDFNTLKPKLIYSNNGNPFEVWGKEMPRISDELLDTVIYLYPSVETAKEGKRYGGTGFLVSITAELYPNIMHTYAVTNSHVIREAKSTVIRLNTHNGKTETLETSADGDWIHHPDGDDIAVCYLGGINSHIIKYRMINSRTFLTKEIIEEFNIGVGDDVFMVGRFSQHDGKQTNLPSARFGNISMMPYERILHPRQYEVDAFLIETRSLSGCSGSPVFVYINPSIPRPNEYLMAIYPNLPLWLLGIDFGHMNITEQVKEKDGKTNVQEGYLVQSNSGQMMVSPVWKLQELLDSEEFVMARKENEKEYDNRQKDVVSVMDMMQPDEKVSFTKDTFEESLKCVSQKVSEPDEETKET